jgi:hypothetical protein
MASRLTLILLSIVFLYWGPASSTPNPPSNGEDSAGDIAGAQVAEGPETPRQRRSRRGRRNV